MRLLEKKGPGEFSLIEVPTHNAHNTHPYAILSHTWADQEVTYQELIGGTGKDKSGYKKIEFCGDQAARDGLQYFWVDTCCIDKTNGHELSKAINSMFRWYQNAAKCYVFLTDVPSVVHGTDVQAEQSTWEAAFWNNRWFTRGWTLQELIAPSIVEFFSRERELLGDKRALEKPIHEITKIPIQALRGDPFSDFSVDERRGWADNRQTTEEEDLVYCLLGLCEVSMPYIYGEGKAVAMKRLQMTIKGFSNHSSEPKDPEDHKVPFIVPFDRNLNFTGRETQLSEVDKKLFVGGRTTKVAITGLGGIGKTQLLLELVYRIRDRYKNCLVIWIPATNMESLNQAYQDVARQLKIPGSEDDKSDAKKLLQGYLGMESVGRWLLVFDNADDINMWIAKSENGSRSGRLIDYLPRSEQGCIVFTTRDRKTAVKLAHQNIVDVPAMDEDVAIQLLKKCLINSDLVNDRTDTIALLKELTYLPLAIVQAVAYINENDILFGDYLSLLTDQEEAVINLLSEEFEDDGRYENIKNPVATTWLISFEQIRYLNPLAADYLSFMACIDPKDIPQSLLPVGASRKEEIDAIGTLSAYSFITKRQAAPALDLHRLVHLATRNWLKQKDLITQWTERAIMQLEEVFPNDDHQNRNKWRTYLPHVSCVLISDKADRNGEIRIALLQRFGRCLLSDGRYNEAEALFVEVVERNKEILGQEHPKTLTNIAALASTYWNQGRWREAEDLEVDVMETRKRVSGLEHLDTLTSMNNLASIYWNQGRLKEAEDLAIQVIEARKRILGEEHPETVTIKSILALIYFGQGRWAEAEELQAKVLEIRSRVLGQEHPNTLTSMNNLALTFRSQGRWTEAEELEVKVLEIRSRVLGQEHPNTLTSMNNLALTFWNQGRWTEAQELEAKVLEIRSRVLGQEHPSTLTSMNNLASTFRSQGRWTEAEELEVKVLDISSRVLGQEHPNTLTSMNNLALTFWNQGRWTEAQELEAKVLEIRSGVLGQEHPSTLTSMANLASTFRSQGRWTEAEELEARELEICSKVLGQEHPSTLTSMNNLASTFRSQGRWTEAEELQAKVLEIWSRVLGQEHPSTLTSMANLASTFSSQGRWTEAEELEVKVLEIRSRVLGQEHPDTLTSMNNLASMFWNQGRWTEAQELQARVLEISSRVLGQEHPSTLISMNNLASTFRSQGRWTEAEELQAKVLEIWSRVLGQEHPFTLTSMNNLALTLSSQGRWAEAEELQAKVLEIWSRVLGQEHPDTLTSMANLAYTWRDQGRDVDALNLMKQCVDMRARIIGADHPSTLSSSKTLLEWENEEWEDCFSADGEE